MSDRLSVSTDEDGEDGAGQAGDYDDDDDEEEDEDGSEGGEVGLSFQVNRADQVGNSGFSLQVDPQTPPHPPLPRCSARQRTVCTKHAAASTHYPMNKLNTVSGRVLVGRADLDQTVAPSDAQLVQFSAWSELSQFPGLTSGVSVCWTRFSTNMAASETDRDQNRREVSEIRNRTSLSLGFNYNLVSNT